MESENFKLNSIEEVKQFTEKIDNYHKSKTGFSFPYIDLCIAFENLKNHSEGGKLFTALLDLKINLFHLSTDFISTSSNSNLYNTSPSLQSGTILNNQILFNHKFEAHYNRTNFVYRYRAIWDKIMGIFILMYIPDDYEKFRKAKSRRKEFQKLSVKIPGFTKEQVEILLNGLTEFDRIFRTPEIHATGSLRKWSFNSIKDYPDSPLFDLNFYWNWLLPTLTTIDKILLTKKFNN